jgi:hypothetical protein
MISPSSNHNEERSHCFCASQNKGSEMRKKYQQFENSWYLMKLKKII